LTLGQGLRDHVAVVTGASSGVGRAIALALASQGAALYLVGRQLDRLNAVAEQAAGGAGRVFRCAVDLTSDGGVEELVGGVRRDCGGVDILIHSAGVFARGVVGGDPADLDEQYRTNLRAPYVLTGRLLPLFRPGRGQIVFVNSSVGLRASAGVAAYGATKHALRALADGLRDEVNPRGIRILSVFIGRTATPMQEDIHRLEGKTYRPERLLQPDDVGSTVLHALLLPRTAEITDISIRPLAKPEC
jgi:NAD(P)-dependent dehydrogenase (short-subunit alcohol dehydrogenase family)